MKILQEGRLQKGGMIMLISWLVSANCLFLQPMLSKPFPYWSVVEDRVVGDADRIRKFCTSALSQGIR